jgi:hypothetical protein
MAYQRSDPGEVGITRPGGDHQPEGHQPDPVQRDPPSRFRIRSPGFSGSLLVEPFLHRVESKRTVWRLSEYMMSGQRYVKPVLGTDMTAPTT